jgi:phenylacetate-CoA ligase
MEKYVEHMRSLGACYIHTYPSSLNILVCFLRRSGIAPPANIQGLLVGSENVYTKDRAAAEEMFDCRYLSWYGHSEKLVFAAECEHSSNYHIYPTYGFCELIDKEGKVITTPGMRGEIVGTGFINEIMPFIRYKTGDYATLVGQSCEQCGRNHTVISDVSGHRILEMLVTRDEALIPWAAINTHDDTFENVLQIQFVQSEIGKATLKIVPAKNADDICAEKIEKHLRDKLEGQLQFDIEIVDSIELTNRGKSIYVDQKLDTEEILMRKK